MKVATNRLWKNLRNLGDCLPPNAYQQLWHLLPWHPFHFVDTGMSKYIRKANHFHAPSKVVEKASKVHGNGLPSECTCFRTCTFCTGIIFMHLQGRIISVSICVCMRTWNLTWNIIPVQNQTAARCGALCLLCKVQLAGLVTPPPSRCLAPQKIFKSTRSYGIHLVRTRTTPCEYFFDEKYKINKSKLHPLQYLFCALFILQIR